MKKTSIILFIFFRINISFCQIPKGYYFMEIKGTKWFSNEKIMDSTIFAEKHFGLTIMNKISDNLKQNIWKFTDSLIIQYYDINRMKYNTLFSCQYVNNEDEKKLILIFQNGKKITYDYNSVSTGNYIGLWKEK